MALGDWPPHCALLKIPGVLSQATGIRVVDFGTAHHQNRLIIHYLGYSERGKWMCVVSPEQMKSECHFSILISVAHYCHRFDCDHDFSRALMLYCTTLKIKVYLPWGEGKTTKVNEAIGFVLNWVSHIPGVTFFT